MSNVDKAMLQAQKVCAEQGLKLTKKRRQVLHALLESKTSLSAYELRESCKTDAGELPPPMSVYRILHFLQEAGFVHRLNLSNRYTACVHITCNHAHRFSQFLICIRCQMVTEINIPELTVTTMISDAELAGFELTKPQLEISGVCYSCKNKAA